jgi:hypothetical protein
VNCGTFSTGFPQRAARGLVARSAGVFPGSVRLAVAVFPALFRALCAPGALCVAARVLRLPVFRSRGRTRRGGRASADRVPMTRVRRDRVLVDSDRVERVLRRPRVVTDRHLLTRRGHVGRGLFLGLLILGRFILARFVLARVRRSRFFRRRSIERALIGGRLVRRPGLILEECEWTSSARDRGGSESGDEQQTRGQKRYEQPSTHVGPSVRREHVPVRRVRRVTIPASCPRVLWAARPQSPF